ncbi:MAG: hypothetical protein BV456_00575 [Thermoplasmata archaeon M8B2D]|nr:MAG: hypothetical protein BV456_00575 [Thermoplasmata archaeon M8B2D]
MENTKVYISNLIRETEKEIINRNLNKDNEDFLIGKLSGLRTAYIAMFGLDTSIFSDLSKKE